jgi:hypothetical protein
MADRDAKVRLNLAANGFLTQLQQLQAAAKDFEKAVEGVGDGGEKASKKLGAFATAGKAGLGAMKSSLSELGSSLKSTLTQVATLGGALSLASAARGSIELTKTYKDIAYAIHAGTGEAMSWQTVQKQIEGTAARWKRGNAEVAESYKALWDDIGDAKFAAAGVESVARAATAGAGSVGALTTVVGQLKEKFDIGSGAIDDTLATLYSLTNKGGANMEQLGDKIGLLGASAKEAGYGSADGMSRMIAMLNIADGVTGNFKRNVKSVTSIFDTISDPDKLKAAGAALHTSFIDQQTKKPFKSALEQILKKTGGKQEVLAKIFQGDELNLMVEFGKTYAKAFDQTKGDIKTKMAAGIAAYNEKLKEQSTAAFRAADMDKQAKERLADADRQMADAMRKLEVAFTSPKMVDGLMKLAEVAPKVADALAKLLGFAVDHPKSAMAAVVGAKVGSAVLPAVAGSLMSAGAKGLWKTIAGRVAGAGASAAAGAEGAAGAAAAGVGGTAAAGVAAVLGTAAAIGLPIAAGAGYLTYKNEENKVKGRRRRDGTMQSITDVSMADTPEEYDKHRAESERRNALTEIRKMGVAQTLDRYGASPTAAQAPAKVAANTATSLHALEKSLHKGSASGDKAAHSLSRFAAEADRVSGILSKFGGPDGSNGLPPAPGNQSGSTPR